MNDKIVLKLQMEIGFEKDSAIGDIDVAKKNFKNALKESVLELLQAEIENVKIYILMVMADVKGIISFDNK